MPHTVSPEPESPYALEDRLRARDRRRLFTAFVAAGVLHVGTAFAIVYAPKHEAVEPPGEMTITIDLAPALASAESVVAGETQAVEAAAAEPSEVEETPPDPEPVEEVVEETPPEPVQEPEPPPPEPVPEPLPEPEPVEELPPVPDPPQEIIEAPPPPPAAEPEVVVPPKAQPKPKPKPVEKPKKPVEKPREEARKPKPKPPAATPSSAAAASASRRQSDTAGSGARATPSEINRYTGQVRAAIERRKRAQSSKGTVYVSFTIQSSGSVTGVRVTKSSGDPGLDDAARSAVSSASIPPIPSGMASRMNIGVPIRFN
ncbi:energy transducer TonB [Terrihabitans rhizophilus]|uniref:Protein TonB n=1 Tax=Terrihabitans rhizophilus TaxID=3092662 RepID=A0ABU4RQ74_9HYPH|nr:energy transducer TonB [Terrihabitans sp. PJ23]MDX6806993.1 energy transducer TonB [Terrihabitans sp. PJ23]